MNGLNLVYLLPVFILTDVGELRFLNRLKAVQANCCMYLLAVEVLH